jgi:hypothetical protein
VQEAAKLHEEVVVADNKIPVLDDLSKPTLPGLSRAGSLVASSPKVAIHRIPDLLHQYLLYLMLMRQLLLRGLHLLHQLVHGEDLPLSPGSVEPQSHQPQIYLPGSMKM